ncbi:Sodium/solute symporter [Macrophomina phaseolina MS6]|uniref:Sodium/solute symporter n=1 Tax=Macrophomina phaseolina (strain MS6) TaxID=1126212 RepID=K2S6R6_MACPH|nr:Sodium/solute symporter [Macrophomina phaseolina MS6]
MQHKYTTFSTHRAEKFNTASRSVKPGLIGPGGGGGGGGGIVSSWTWFATLWTFSAFAYSYDVCGPMCVLPGLWDVYRSLLFALITVKVKGNAPGAYTFPEIVFSRHGKVAHTAYLIADLCCNMLVGACLVLGGSQVVAALSAVNVHASFWLVPFIAATDVGASGLRSMFIAIFVFCFLVWGTSDFLGSPSRVHDILVEASERMPIEGNKDGSYLAFQSVDELIFAVDLLVTGFHTVWLDQACWQRAIASRPETSIQAYILGVIAWYGIPFGFEAATGLGIYSVALAAFCYILKAVGVNLTWLLTVLSIIVRGAAIPVGFVLLWDKTNTTASVFTPCIALTFGLISSFVAAQKRSGGVSIETTGDTTNAVARNVTSCAGGAVVAITLGLPFPRKHVSTDPMAIERYNKVQGIAPTRSASPPTGEIPSATKLLEGIKEKSDDPEALAAKARSASPRVKSQGDILMNPHPETFVATGNELVGFLK